MNITKKPLLILSVILLVACAPSPTSPGERINAPEQESAPLDASQAQSPESVTPVEVGNDELWLRILSPADEAIVNTSQIEVTGEAPAETILSINDEVLLVPADGVFRQIILLEEGANLLEFLASNYNGDEISVSLIVYYEP